MATVTIDGVEHQLEDLSESARAQLNALQATDGRIAQAQQELAILQTARAAYAAALQRELPTNDGGDDDDE